MFNIFEGNADAKALKLQERLEILKRARENFFWATSERLPIPEIVADGKGPDDGWMPWPRLDKIIDKLAEERDSAPPAHGEYSPNPGGNVAGPAPTHKYYTNQPCNLCNGYTRHIRYGSKTLIWHCTACCTCDLCMAEAEYPPGFQTVTDPRVGQAQVAAGHEALHDALTTPIDQLFFCTKCGAGLRCGVCNNTGTGRYCDLCGKKDTGEGFCTNCWKEEDKDG